MLKAWWSGVKDVERVFIVCLDLHQGLKTGLYMETIIASDSVVL